MKKEKFGDLQITSGEKAKLQGRDPCCNICKKIVSQGQRGITTHTIGEVSRTWHVDCFKLVARYILAL